MGNKTTVGLCKGYERLFCPITVRFVAEVLQNVPDWSVIGILIVDVGDRFQSLRRGVQDLWKQAALAFRRRNINTVFIAKQMRMQKRSWTLVSSEGVFQQVL